jgi:hypothetical protein
VERRTRRCWTWSRSSRSVSAHFYSSSSSSFYPGSQRADHSYSLYSFFGWGRRQHIVPARAGQMKNEKYLRETAVASQDTMRAFFILRGVEPSGFPRALSCLVFIPHDPIFEKSYGTQKNKKKSFFYFYFFNFFLVPGVRDVCARRARDARDGLPCPFSVRCTVPLLPLLRALCTPSRNRISFDI